MIRTSSEGDELWNKTFGGESYEFGRSVQQTSDGGFILAGNTQSYGAGSVDGWLIRTGSDGTELWNKTFGGTGGDGLESVQQTPDGGFILAGFTNSSGAGSSDCWLIRTNSDGTELWNKTFGGYLVETAYSVQQTADGGFSLVGRTSTFGAGSYDFWLIRTGSEGNELWNKTFGGAYEDTPLSAQQTSDGGFILVGFISDGFRVPADLWLVKTEGDGSPLCDLTVALSDYPASVARNGTLAFTATASNGCDDPLTFDRAVMNITGPASLDKTLYDGDPFTVVGSVGTDLSLGVPSRAPLGTYTVEVTIFRDGETIDADSFDVEVSG